MPKQIAHEILGVNALRTHSGQLAYWYRYLLTAFTSTLSRVLRAGAPGAVPGAPPPREAAQRHHDQQHRRALGHPGRSDHRGHRAGGDRAGRAVQL